MQFRPTIKLTLTLIILTTLFTRLGMWQMERKAEKQELFDRFENAPLMQVEQAIRQEELFARAEAFGRYDAKRSILLDNKIWQGRAGVHVLTPFILADGTTLLVNRGWLPLPPDRSALPEVPGDEFPRSISGRLNKLPTEGPRLGDADVLLADSWPQLVTYFDTKTVETALAVKLAPWQLQLEAADDSGFEGRQWEAAVMEPKVHGAYAVQWFSLAIATIIIWITLGVRRGQLLRQETRTGGDTRSGANKE